jgi:AcrR family transcriptional regulator
MIQSAALLFRERGIDGTAFAAVLDHSGAPRGSVYHHFPGGKQQLAEETTRYAGDFLAAGITTALDDHDPVAAVGTIIDTWIAIVRDSDYEAGCPIVAAALEGNRAPSARDAAGSAFAKWEQILSDAITRQGVPSDRAQRLATLIITSVEGAIVLARAQRTTTPLERVATELKALVADGIVLGSR